MASQAALRGDEALLDRALLTAEPGLNPPADQRAEPCLDEAPLREAAPTKLPDELFREPPPLRAVPPPPTLLDDPWRDIAVLPAGRRASYFVARTGRRTGMAVTTPSP